MAICVQCFTGNAYWDAMCNVCLFSILSLWKNKESDFLSDFNETRLVVVTCALPEFIFSLSLHSYNPFLIIFLIISPKQFHSFLHVSCYFQLIWVCKHATLYVKNNTEQRVIQLKEKWCQIIPKIGLCYFFPLNVFPFTNNIIHSVKDANISGRKSWVFKT